MGSAGTCKGNYKIYNVYLHTMDSDRNVDHCVNSGRGGGGGSVSKDLNTCLPFYHCIHLLYLLMGAKHFSRTYTVNTSRST